MKKLAGAVAAVFLLAGCAIQPVPRSLVNHYRTIGVLSSIGTDFPASRVGITVFGNAYRPQTIDLEADRLFTDSVIRNLSGKYTLTNLNKYSKAFHDTPFYWSVMQKSLIDESRPLVGQVLSKLVGTEKYDAYIIISPGSGNLANRDQGVGGIGVLELDRLFLGETCVLHAAYMVTVIDGKDFSVVGDMRASSLGGLVPINVPTAPIDCSIWESPTLHLTDVKAALASLIERSVPETLTDAQLLP